MRNDSEFRGEMVWQKEDASAGRNLVLGSYALQDPLYSHRNYSPHLRVEKGSWEKLH